MFENMKKGCYGNTTATSLSLCMAHYTFTTDYALILRYRTIYLCTFLKIFPQLISS